MSKKSINLTWNEFQKLGNPEYVDNDQSNDTEESVDYEVVLRIHIEKKGRGGKMVSIIKGWRKNHKLKDLCKLLKQKCGVGGSVKDYSIIIQGDNRDKILQELGRLGYRNVKKSGG